MNDMLALNLLVLEKNDIVIKIFKELFFIAYILDDIFF